MMPRVPVPVAVARRLGRAVDRCVFGPPVACVYNPLDYAFEAHRTYLERYCRQAAGVLLVGMNPGPFGMVQTGVPFGEVAAVRDWLGIDGGVAMPAIEHPKRPVQGFACPRSEVSGQRFWGWARERFGTPHAFFDEFFVWNYCPLAFMEAGGRNRTPDKLPRHEREPLYAACDRALAEIAEYVNPDLVLGIGRYSEQRARAVLGETRPVHGVLHPSPASPRRIGAGPLNSSSNWRVWACRWGSRLGCLRSISSAPRPGTAPDPCAAPSACRVRVRR